MVGEGSAATVRAAVVMATEASSKDGIVMADGSVDQVGKSPVEAIDLVGGGMEGRRAPIASAASSSGRW